MSAATTKRKAFLYLLGTFLAGLIAGGAGGYHWNKFRMPKHQSPEQMAQGMEKLLREKLDLTDDQALKSRPILLETAAKLQDNFRQLGQQMDQLFHENNRKLGEFLTPEQIRKLNELEEGRKRMFKNPANANQEKPARENTGASINHCNPTA